MDSKTINKRIGQLVEYGIRTGLVPEEEKIFTVNTLLMILEKDDYEEPAECDSQEELENILKDLADYAVEKGLTHDDTITSRDLFDTKLMSALVPRPKTVIDKFNELYRQSPKQATDYYYKFSQDTDYIRRYRVSKDMKWIHPSEFGDIDITINLSKPEKDPKAIAAAKNAPQSAYPKCLLCMENEGYAGRLNHPARETHRIIPISICGSKWGFQYSPYVYYNEHCIVFNGEHTPMKIEKKTFEKLFDFVRQFPHYILGSNADLPIVGGSILAHDHFQGGSYTFAMAKAPLERTVTIPGFEDVEAGIVHWPMSVIRISSTDSKRLVELADHILGAWREYSDETAFIFAKTDGEPHNTITPIARMKDGKFELDLVLRNNLTTPDRPLGVYHPRPEFHHIKKENIGLIEVMGLAILPARLKKEMTHLKELILSSIHANGQAGASSLDIRSFDDLEKHADWFDSFKDKYTFDETNITSILKDEIGEVFVHVLEDAGVYKLNSAGRDAFMRFIRTL